VKAYDGTVESSTAVQVYVDVAAVNDAPVATSQTGVAATAGTTASITLAGTDAEGATLTYSLPSSTSTGGATLSISGNTVTYNLEPNGSTSSDSFTFTVSDGTATDSGTVGLTITQPAFFAKYTPAASYDVDSTSDVTLTPTVLVGGSVSTCTQISAPAVGPTVTCNGATGVVTLKKDVMTPSSGTTYTFTLGDGTATQNVTVNLVVGSASQRTKWTNMKNLLSATLTDGPNTNANSCISCHFGIVGGTSGAGTAGSQASRPWSNKASTSASGFQWFCRNIRNKTNPAGATNYAPEGSGTVSNASFEHANCLAAATGACTNTGGPLWTSSSSTGTQNAGVTALAGVRDSRFVEKIIGNGGGYTAVSTQMPLTGAVGTPATYNPVKVDTAGQNAFTAAMVNDWYDAGAPCEP